MPTPAESALRVIFALLITSQATYSLYYVIGGGRWSSMQPKSKTTDTITG